MIKLKTLLFEDGALPGKLELVSTSLERAREYASYQFETYNSDLDTELPNFDVAYKLAQKKANMGKTQRKDMPVIDDKDVKAFQGRLQQGYIDINSPYSKETKSSNPFPTGLSGANADQWLKNGLKMYDSGKPTDDVIKVKLTNTKASKLIPIQKQIYFDKSIDAIAKFGVASSNKFMKSTTFIVSSDNHIIDGHHRFLSAILMNPNQAVHTLVIDLPISKLLPLALAYGDAIGNKRNG